MLWSALSGCNQRRHFLLHEMDHKAFLSECRKVIADAGPKARVSETGFVRVCPPPDCGAETRLPEAIRKLHPTEVGVSADVIHIELAGGFVHYGFEAIREGAPASVAEAIQSATGRKRLIEGLWFYEGG